MRAIFAVVLLAGLGLAGFAAYMARDYVTAYQSALEQERAARADMVETVEVYVAGRPLRYGENVTPEDVRTVKWPANALPEGAFRSADELFPGEETRTALRAMEEGEAILAVKVTEPGEDAGVSSKLPAGMRAFAVSVDVTSGVSGFLRPADRVDVYWTGRVASGQSDGEVTKLIQAAMRIVAIDQSADEDRSHPAVARTVTLEATPQQVARLAQAQSTGRLSLSLVGAADDVLAENVEVDQRGLLGLPERLVAEVQAPKKSCSVRMRRGLEVIETPIPCTN